MLSSALSRMSQSRSNRDRSAAGSAMFSLGDRRVSYRPHAGLAAASTCGFARSGDCRCLNARQQYAATLDSQVGFERGFEAVSSHVHHEIISRLLRTVVRVFSVVVMPAFAMLTVCCSMTCEQHKLPLVYQKSE